MALSPSEVQILLNRMRKQLAHQDKQSPKFGEENQALVSECQIHYPNADWFGVLCKASTKPPDAIEFFVGLVSSIDSYSKALFLSHQIIALSDSKNLDSYLLAAQFALMVFPQLQVKFEFSKDEEKGYAEFIVQFLANIANYSKTYKSLQISYLQLGQGDRISTLTQLFSKAQRISLVRCDLTATPIISLTGLLNELKQTEAIAFSYTSLHPLQSNLFNIKPTPFQQFCDTLVAMPVLKELVFERANLESLQAANLKYLLDALKISAARQDLPPLAITLNLNPFYFYDIQPFEIERVGKADSPKIRLFEAFILDYPGQLNLTFDFDSSESTLRYGPWVDLFKARFDAAQRQREESMASRVDASLCCSGG